MADTLKEVNSPAYVNAATLRQAASLKVVRDLAGGTKRMRERGTAYLPIEDGESTTSYNVRLARSLLFNTPVKAREGFLGIALKRNPELQSDVPALIKQYMEDIDLANSHLDVWLKDFFRDVIYEGHAHALVDMQPPLPPGSTRADEIASGRRPYVVKYKKDDAINWKSDRINGETVLTQITFEECATEDEGQYGEKEVTRYRVLRLPKLAEKTATRAAIYGPMEWELFEKQKTGTSETIIKIGGGVTDLPKIPVVTVYSRRIGFMESEPPLIDLCYLAIGHWQQWSDLNAQLRMLVPMLFIQGEIACEKDAQGKEVIKAGPGTAIRGTGENTKVAYVSHDGAAIKATRESLMDLEQRMSAISLSLIAAKQDREVTATEKAFDQDERISELASWLRNMKDGVESILKLFASYLGLPEGGSIILGFDEPDEADKSSLQAINAPKTPTGMAGQVADGGVQ